MAALHRGMLTSFCGGLRASVGDNRFRCQTGMGTSDAEEIRRNSEAAVAVADRQMKRHGLRAESLACVDFSRSEMARNSGVTAADSKAAWTRKAVGGRGVFGSIGFTWFGI